jgi:hypothetical protein
LNGEPRNTLGELTLINFAFAAELSNRKTAQSFGPSLIGGPAAVIEPNLQAAQSFHHAARIIAMRAPECVIDGGLHAHLACFGLT